MVGGANDIAVSIHHIFLWTLRRFHRFNWSTLSGNRTGRPGFTNTVEFPSARRQKRLPTENRRAISRLVSLASSGRTNPAPSRIKSLSPGKKKWD
jgi:hypothetical protein